MITSTNGLRSVSHDYNNECRPLLNRFNIVDTVKFHDPTICWVFTLAPVVECKGILVSLSVCLFVCPLVQLKNYCPDWLFFFYTRRLRRPLIWSESGWDHLLKDSSSFWDRTRYYIKERCHIKRALWWNKCVMTSNVHNRERMFAVSDCLVLFMRSLEVFRWRFIGMPTRSVRFSHPVVSLESAFTLSKVSD